MRAEEKRLGQQLEHDRALDDRQELRTFLDEVAETYEDLHHAYTQLIVVLRTRPLASSDAEVKLNKMEATADPRVTQGLLAVGRIGRRIALRFPTDHALVVALQQAAGELKAGVELFDRPERDPVDRSNQMEGHAQTALNAFRQFGDAARAIFE